MPCLLEVRSLRLRRRNILKKRIRHLKLRVTFRAEGFEACWTEPFCLPTCLDTLAPSSDSLPIEYYQVRRICMVVMLFIYVHISGRFHFR